MNRDGWIIAGAIAGLVLLSGGAVALATYSGKLSMDQLQQLAAGAGFSGTDLPMAAAVAMAESSGDPQAHGDLTIGSGTGSFGLWQINADAHPEYGPDFTQLYDPNVNAAAAFAIYSQAGNSFHPWTTYRTGAAQFQLHHGTDPV